MARGLARFLAADGQAQMQREDGQGRLVTTVNGVPVGEHAIAHALAEAGFVPGPLGMHLRRTGHAPLRLSAEEAAKNRPALTRPDGRGN